MLLIDVLVTLPVPKIHLMTRVSLGTMNQWGCQPGAMRLRNHPEFASEVLAINKLVHPKLALYDGMHFLDKSGPMIGEPVGMNMMIAANHVGAGDLVCCDLMGMDVRIVAHLRQGQVGGMVPPDLRGVILNRPPDSFRARSFVLKRAPINYVALATIHFSSLTRVFYDSVTAGPLDAGRFRLRRNRVVGQLLYGRGGPPA